VVELELEVELELDGAMANTGRTGIGLWVGKLGDLELVPIGGGEVDGDREMDTLEALPEVEKGDTESSFPVPALVEVELEFTWTGTVRDSTVIVVRDLQC